MFCFIFKGSPSQKAKQEFLYGSLNFPLVNNLPVSVYFPHFIVHMLIQDS